MLARKDDICVKYNSMTAKSAGPSIHPIGNGMCPTHLIACSIHKVVGHTTDRPFALIAHLLPSQCL